MIEFDWCISAVWLLYGCCMSACMNALILMYYCCMLAVWLLYYCA